MDFINQFFDKIIFIHCIHRKDRKNNIDNLIKNFNLKNTYILEATYLPKNGSKGCSHSHYRAIKLAKQNKWKNILILEDDFYFNEKFDVDTYFKNALESINFDYDVIMPYWLCNSIEKRTIKINKFVRKINHHKYGAYSTLAYAVNENIYDKLENVFLKSYNEFKDIYDREQKKLSTDCIWRTLQKNNKWYIITPLLGYQINTKSDIHCW